MITLRGAAYKVKSSGPSTEPWGIPQFNSLELETECRTLNDCFRFVINDKNHLDIHSKKKQTRKTSDFSLVDRWIVSKERSSKSKAVGLF